VGGIPAKLLKSNVRWERTRQPALKDIQPGEHRRADMLPLRKETDGLQVD
jgi:hypothetical protein